MFAPTPSVCNPQLNIAAQMATEPESKKIYVIRSVWRRLKAGHIVKVGRDLHSVKDVKGGGGATGKSKPITGSTDTTRSH